MKHEQEIPSNRDTVEVYKHLPLHTRTLLEGLDKEDAEALREIIKSYQRASAIGWFFKWLVTFMVGTFMATVAFGESIRKAIAWFVGSN